MAPKSIDHSLHLPVLVSAIFITSLYLGKTFLAPHLLQVWISIFLTCLELPSCTLACMNMSLLLSPLQLLQISCFGVQRIKFLNHFKSDIGSSLSSIRAGINSLIDSKTLRFLYCLVTFFYN